MTKTKKSWRTSSPGKYVWATGAVVVNLVRLPFSTLYYIPKSKRPHPEWTVSQSVRSQIMNSWLYHLAAVEAVTPLDLTPGKLGDRFVPIPRGPSSIFVGAAAPDDEIVPLDTGAIWFPSPPPIVPAADKSTTTGRDKPVIFHIHPGGYVMTDVRSDSSFVAQLLTERVSPGSHVLMNLYRLSSNPGGRFPAALQDTLSAYYHLLQQVPASNIIISGDSAGGHILICLLRYLADHGAETGLPPPRGAVLFSPSIDMLAPLDRANLERIPNSSIDFLEPNFLNWGARRFVCQKPGAGPYMSPLGAPFKSPCPIYAFCGGLELFHDEISKFVGEMKAIEGNEIEFAVERLANHDITFVGHVTGWKKEAENAADAAGKWVSALF